MMPTFPSSPLKFRTAGFPQYGFKAGFQRRPSFPDTDVAYPSSLPSAFVRTASRISLRSVSEIQVPDTHHHASGSPLYPRGPRSGSGSSVPLHPRLFDPIRPTDRHIAISVLGTLYALPSLCVSA